MIEITDTTYFNIKDICTCGQLFRFKIEGDQTTIYAGDQEIVVKTCVDSAQNNKISYKIFSKSDKFIKNYFDLDKNYAIIYSKLSSEANSLILKEALKFGRGIRILNQDPVEVIISFIISQNNNIPRIQKSIEAMCKAYGENKGSYYAFPSLKSLLNATVEDFKQMGLGYRAEYMVEAVKALNTNEFNVETLKKLPSPELKEKLLTLKGVGPKVADCIMLFGFNRFERFPADTWIRHIYEEDFGGSEKASTTKVSEFFENMFKELSGYAQQYLYYYKREKGE